jgi:hypothetical protein
MTDSAAAGPEPETHHRQDRPPFHIKIDREQFRVDQEELTGREVRNLPVPPIGPDRDLFEVLPDQADRKVEDDYVAEIYDGKRFFTAPAHINPGCATD